MSAEKLILYSLIIDYYNVEEGHAYPSIETLALRYGKTADTTSRHLDDLKAVGLIDFEEKGFYVPLVPLKELEFYSEYPEAWESYKKKATRSNSRREASRERIRKWREAKGYYE
jgi:DNA-binding transcriptional ArsR family regulator